MTMTPLERAAHALRVADSCDFHDAENKDYAGMVRAVLTSIREPDEDVIEAGFGDNPELFIIWTAAISPEDRKAIWRAMIDEMLKP